MKMPNALKVAAFATMIGAAGVLFSACQYGASSTQAPASSSSSTGEASQQAANAVTIQNMAFTPQNLRVKVGQTVTWTNQDQILHTVTSDTGAFESGNMNPGGTFSFTFTKAGTFSYHCAIHSGMKAQVTVTE